MHLISYDIQNDSLRSKIAKTLIRYGMYRVQYSVFMGELSTRPLHAIEKALNAYALHPQWITEDAIMLLPLHQYSENHIAFLGKKPDYWDEISGKIHTLFL